MRAQLIPLDGTPIIDVNRDLTVVGRQEDCDLRIDHKSISKLHCVIARTDGLLLLRDLGSTNGTRVNGQRVRRAALLPNDQLAIAGFKYRVFLGPDEPAVVKSQEYTQRLDAREVAGLLGKHDGKDDLEDSGPMPAPVVHNPLPDVYPEEKPEKPQLPV